MSMNLFEAFIKVGVDSSDVDHKLGTIKDSMFSLGDAIKANLLSDVIKNGINFVIDGLEKMGKAAVAFGKDSLDSAISFESAFAGVKKTVNEEYEGMYDDLSEWIKKSSTEMAASKQEIAGVMEAAGQLGVEGYEGLTVFTEAMIKLGNSTNLSSDEAATALARIMNITGESTEDAGKLGAVIVDLGNNFATTESEILNMATRLASTGTISGLTTTEIFALATAMSSVGIQAEAGGTAMVQTLTAISQAVSGAVGDTKELEKAQKEVTKKTEALEKAQKAYDKALESSGKNTTQAKTALNKVKDAQDAYNAAVDKYGKNSDEAAKKQRALENAQMKYDEILSKSSTKAEEAAAKVKKAEEELAQAQQAVESAGAGASEELALIAEVSKMSAEEFVETWKNEPIQAIEAFIGGLGSLEERGMDVNSVLDTLSMDGVRQGNMLKSLSLATDVLTGAVDRANQAYEENSALTNEAEERYKTTESQLAMVKEAFDNVKVAIGEGLQPTFNEFVELAKSGFLAIEEAYESGGFEGLFNELGVQFQKFVDLAVEKLPELQKVLDDIIPGLKEAVETIVATVTTEIIRHIPDILTATGEILTSIGVYFTDHAGDLLNVAETLGNGFVNLINKAAEKISEVPWGEITQGMADYISSHFEDAVFSFSDAATNLIIALSEAIEEAAKELGSTAADVVATLAEALVDPNSIMKLEEAAENLVRGLFDAMVGAREVFMEKAPLILVKIGESLILAGASLMDFGGEINDLIIKGMIDDAGKFSIKIPEIVDKIVEELENNKDKLIEAGRIILAHITHGMSEKAFALGELADLARDCIWELALRFGEWAAEKLPDTGKEIVLEIGKGLIAFDDLIEDAIQWGKDMVANFIEGIKDGLPDMGEAMGYAAKVIQDFIGFSEPKKGPLSNFHTYAPDMMKLFASGIRENTDIVTDQIEKSFDFEDMIKNPDFTVSGDVSGEFTTSSNNNNTKGFVQNITINSPTELNASEISRQIRNQSRDFVLQARVAY